jgi:hypothetical protein
MSATITERAPRTYTVQAASLSLGALDALAGVQAVSRLRAGLYLVVIDPLYGAEAVLDAIRALANAAEEREEKQT